MKTKKLRPILAGLGVLLVLAAVAGNVDYRRVARDGLKPLFCVGVQTAGDGSGHYIGLGYSFDIKGSFLPGDDPYGATEYTFSVLGVRVASGQETPDFPAHLTSCRTSNNHKGG